MTPPYRMPPPGPRRSPALPHKRVWWCHACFVSWYGVDRVCWFCGEEIGEDSMPYRYFRRHEPTAEE